LIRQFLRPVAAQILNMDWGEMPAYLGERPLRLFLSSGAGHSLRFFPDARHLLKNFRGRTIKGKSAPIPCLCRGVAIVEVEDFRRLGMGLAAISDRSCCRQDDMKPEEMYRWVFLERSACACACCRAMEAGHFEDARKFASLYLTLFPACCLMHALLRNELSDGDRHTLLSFAFVFAKLWHGEHLVYSRLPRRYQAQRIRVSAGGEGKGQCRTLFDVDSLEKLVTLAPLLALELFPSRPTRLGAFAAIQQEHLHSHARLLAMTSGSGRWPAGWSFPTRSACSWGAPTKVIPRRPTDRPGGKPSCRPAALCLRRTLDWHTRRLPPFHCPRSCGGRVRRIRCMGTRFPAATGKSAPQIPVRADVASYVD
jgi:hypothetical protein